MGKLIYFSIASLDGYIADNEGNFDWAEPDPEVHAFINDLERPVGTYLYGRVMYEIMVGWETDPTLAEQSPAMRDFAQIWQAADKVVYSRTLRAPLTARTRVEPEFEPAALLRMKQGVDRDIGVGGSDLAGQVVRTGLVDEYHFFLVPRIVGGGKPSLPADLRVDLELLDQRRFDSGIVFLHYRARG